jgi:hypothetical protein
MNHAAAASHRPTGPHLLPSCSNPAFQVSNPIPPHSTTPQPPQPEWLGIRGVLGAVHKLVRREQVGATNAVNPRREPSPSRPQVQGCHLPTNYVSEAGAFPRFPIDARSSTRAARAGRQKTSTKKAVKKKPPPVNQQLRILATALHAQASFAAMASD